MLADHSLRVRGYLLRIVINSIYNFKLWFHESHKFKLLCRLAHVKKKDACRLDRYDTQCMP